MSQEEKIEGSVKECGLRQESREENLNRNFKFEFRTNGKKLNLNFKLTEKI